MNQITFTVIFTNMSSCFFTIPDSTFVYTYVFMHVYNHNERNYEAYFCYLGLAINKYVFMNVYKNTF
jgi:hypothetical protein